MNGRSAHTGGACLAIVLARAGSKGLPGKNLRSIAGRPILAWTLDHAAQSRLVTRVLLSTDSPPLLELAASMHLPRVHRPAELAGDDVTVQAAAAHALAEAEHRWRTRFAQVVILYGNVPVRPADLTDRAVQRLCDAGCDSVQSVCEVGKHHPYWMKRLGGPGGEQLTAFRRNHVDRRQDLPPLYELDGGVIAVRRTLLAAESVGPHGFLGQDQRAVVTQRGDVIDVDESFDLTLAEVVLNQRRRHAA